MQIALLHEFRASRKDPLAPLLERIHQAFLDAGLGEPGVRFMIADAPVPGFVSSVERILKRHPELERFRASASALPGGPQIRQLTNLTTSPAHGETIPFATLLSIAGGVPRSFPIHKFSVHLSSPAFGELQQLLTMMPGVHVTDSWWVNGRQRTVSALTMVDAELTARKLPIPTGPLAVVLEACGKVAKTRQVPLVQPPGAQSQAADSSRQASALSVEAREAIAAIIRNFRARLPEIIDRAALPHDLPPRQELPTQFGETSGPRKPALEQAFKPMGYTCRGGSGTFSLRRRTAANFSVEISLDVGTWSHQIIGFYAVQGLGFIARLPLPLSRHVLQGQYPIGDAERWQKIVDNLAAIVAEYDRTFVPAIEAAAAPAPEWFQPES